jgi:hypothetical protein
MAVKKAREREIITGTTNFIPAEFVAGWEKNTSKFDKSALLTYGLQFPFT